MATITERNAKTISKLHPEFRPMVEEFLKRAIAKGLNPLLTYGLRTFQEQAELYNRPFDGIDNDADGKIDEADEKVTNAKEGESYHNYGLAFDVVNVVKGKAVWDVKDSSWLQFAEIGKGLGMTWGGDFKSLKGGDRPHFEWSRGIHWKKLMERVRAKKVKDGYVILSMLLLCFLMFGCGAEYHVKRMRAHRVQAEAKGAVITPDTVWGKAPVQLQGFAVADSTEIKVTNPCPDPEQPISGNILGATEDDVNSFSKDFNWGHGEDVINQTVGGLNVKTTLKRTGTKAVMKSEVIQKDTVIKAEVPIAVNETVQCPEEKKGLTWWQMSLIGLLILAVGIVIGKIL
jgi:peptidoglycan L-alanyl-D-glutamate endopeptidase CwlK